MLYDLLCLWVLRLLFFVSFVFLFWEPTIMLGNQFRPQQRQHPLGWALLVTANKDADLQRASQSVSHSYAYLWTAHLGRT
jgi:hypothetical protein